MKFGIPFLTTNTIVCCTVFLLIVSYALNQAAHAESSAEREYARALPRGK